MPEEQNAAQILSDFSTKIRNLEEKINLLRERMLILGQSFLKQEEEIKEDTASLKDESRDMRLDMDRLKDKVDHIIQELENFARREELLSVQKYMKIWEPLKYTTEEDVKKMINEALEEIKIPKLKITEHQSNKNYIN